MNIKQTIITLCACLTLIASANAQLVLSDFDSYTNDADSVYADGVFWTDAGNVTQQSGGVRVLNGNAQGNLSFEFTLGQDYTGYSQVELQFDILTGNTTDITFFILNSSLVPIASAVFDMSPSDTPLTVGTYTLLANLTPLNGGLTSNNAFTWGLGGSGSPSETANIQFNNIALIPEPSTYALLMLGAGAIGFMVRRRKA